MTEQEPDNIIFKVWLLIIAGIIIAFFVYVINENELAKSYKDQPFANKIELSPIMNEEVNNISKDYLLLPDNKALFVSSNDNVFTFMDLKTLQVMATEQIEKSYRISKLKTWDQYILVFLTSGEVLFIDHTTYKIVKRINVTETAGEYVEVFDHYALISDHRSVTLLDLETDKTIYDKSIGAIVDIQLLNNHVIYNLDIDSNERYNIYVADVWDFTETWRFEEITSVHGISSFFPVKDVVVYQSHDKLIVFNLLTGKEVERKPFYDCSIYIVRDKILYHTSSQFGSELIYSDLNGIELWRYITPSAVAISGDRYVYVYNDVEKLVKIDAETGKKLYRIEDVDLIMDNVVSTAKYDIFNSLGGNINLINKENGKKVWRYDLKSLRNDKAFWFVTNERLFVYDGSSIKTFEL